MYSLNKVQLIGNLTKDPETKQFDNGGQITNFSIATNFSYKTKEGERKDIAEYHNVVANNKLAEICSDYLRKGLKVYVEGRMRTRSYEDKNGTKKYTTEVVLSNMIILTPKDNNHQEDEDLDFMNE